MEANTTSEQFNCSRRYALNEPNVDEIPLIYRYQPHILLQLFMPGTLMAVRVLMITWLTVGLFGNSLSFAIWVSKPQRRKNTSAIYLCALALTDLILILTLVDYHVVRYWGLTGVSHLPGLCHIYQCVVILAQYYSTTLVFGFTLERYLAVCFPFKRHKLCTARRAVLAVVILLLICFVPMVMQGVMWTYENGECIMKRELVDNRTFQGALLGQEVLFSLVIPLAALVFNLLLLKEMRRLLQATAVPASARQNGTASIKLASRPRQSSAYSLHSNGSNVIATRTESARQRPESSGFVATTVMLVILSFYLIACAVPPGVVYLAQFVWNEPDLCLTDQAIRADPEWQTMFGQMQAKELIDVLCASHYALNFFIYILTSKAFREQAFSILSCDTNRLRRLSKPAAADTWTLPRRTGPRSMRTRPLGGEQENLLDVTDVTINSTQPNQSHNQ